MDRDEELDKQILEYVKKHQNTTAQEIAKEQKRRYPTVWKHIQALLAQRKLVKVELDGYILNGKHEKIPLYIETTLQGGRFITPEYFREHRYDVLFRFEDAQAKGKAIEAGETAKWKKKYENLVKLRIPPDKAELFKQLHEKVLSLEDVVAKYKLWFEERKEERNGKSPKGIIHREK